MVSAISREIVSWNLMKFSKHDEMVTAEFNILWAHEKAIAKHDFSQEIHSAFFLIL